MNARRLRFYVALGVFAVWVSALATLALLSSREPPRRPALQAPR